MKPTNCTPSRHSASPPNTQGRTSPHQACRSSTGLPAPLTKSHTRSASQPPVTLEPAAPSAPAIIKVSAIYLIHNRAEKMLAVRSVRIPIRIRATVKWSTNGCGCHAFRVSMTDCITLPMPAQVRMSCATHAGATKIPAIIAGGSLCYKLWDQVDSACWHRSQRRLIALRGRSYCRGSLNRATARERWLREPLTLKTGDLPRW